MTKSIGTTIAKILFYLVAAVLLAWTATLTYTFVAAALPEMPWYVPLLALVVFDVGMIAWMYVFIQYAEGAGQRAVSILLCVFDFFGVALLIIAEVLLGGQTWAVPPESLGEMAVWGIAIWTVVNVAGVVAFHLLSPEARKLMAFQGEKDAIVDAAFEQLKNRRVANSSRLADGLSKGMYDQPVVELFADKEGGIPDTVLTRREAVDDEKNTRSNSNERGNGPVRPFL